MKISVAFSFLIYGQTVYCLLYFIISTPPKSHFSNVSAIIKHICCVIKHFPSSPHWWPLAHSWKDRNCVHVDSCRYDETQTFECVNWIISLSLSHLWSVMSSQTHIHDNSVSGVVAVFCSPYPGYQIWFSRLACNLLLLACHRITDLQNGSCWKGPHWVILSNLPAQARSP